MWEIVKRQKNGFVLAMGIRLDGGWMRIRKRIDEVCCPWPADDASGYHLLTGGDTPCIENAAPAM